MIYNVLPPRDTAEKCTDCLTFSAPETFSISVTSPGWDGTMEYSKNQKRWKTWDGSEISGTRIYLRGIGNTVVTMNQRDMSWDLTGSNISCTGNIETLLDYQTVAAGEHPTMGGACYAYMFTGCTGLTAAPELPATKLAQNCYAYMFNGCTSLTTAPALPATTLGYSCYQYMFSGCTSLTTAPALPATFMQGCCYESMFSGCTSLKLSATQTDEYTKSYRIPVSGEGTTATDALTDMFGSTGGTFTETPEINTVYYLHKDCSIVGNEGYDLPDAD